MICNDWSCTIGSGKPDYKPATSTDFHQKRQEKPKNWEVEVVEVIFLLYAREEKVKIFLTYKRYGNDLLRLPPFVPPNDDNFNPRRKETPKLGCFRHRCPTNNNSIKRNR